MNIVVPHTYIGPSNYEPDSGVFQEYDGQLVIRRFDWIAEAKDENDTKTINSR